MCGYHCDPTGFFKGQLVSDSITRLLHICRHDRVRWDNLWAVLEEINFGTKFLTMIKRFIPIVVLLYKHNILSKTFPALVTASVYE